MRRSTVGLLQCDQTLLLQGLHRLEKYLNLEGFLEKSLKIKICLEKSLNSTIFCRT